jgi:guanine deaminase
MKSHDHYLDEAFAEAFTAVRNNLGGPFGAVVVRDGVIIGRGSNHVLSENDPTAHAEIVAIRQAGKTTGSFDLSGSVIYATCEPCPMCLSAIYWANIKTYYYCSSKKDAEKNGFKDYQIYRELGMNETERSIRAIRMEHPASTELFAEWDKKEDKIPY